MSRWFLPAFLSIFGITFSLVAIFCSTNKPSFDVPHIKKKREPNPFLEVQKNDGYYQEIEQAFRQNGFSSERANKATHIIKDIYQKLYQNKQNKVLPSIANQVTKKKLLYYVFVLITKEYK